MTLPALDILKFVLAALIVVAFTLGGVCWAGQTRISRSPRNLMVIASRLLLIYGATFFVLCVWIGLRVDLFLILLSIFVVLSPVASLDVFNRIFPNDSGELLIVILVLGPVFVLKQIVLGFPERDEIILSPPKTYPTPKYVQEEAMPDLTDQTVTVVSTLRPLGKIDHQGKRFDAASFDGNIIEVGQTVQVCDRQNRMYVVRPMERSKL